MGLRLDAMRWRDAMIAVLDLALPVNCAGCGRPGTPWCRRCQAEIATAWGGGARRVWPMPCPPGFPPTWASTPYEGPPRHALAAYKDDGRGDLTAVLAPPLTLSLAAALASLRPGEPLVVPVPTTAAARRRRGEAPMERLAAHACGLLGSGTGVTCDPRALAARRRLADQSGLSIAARSTNLGGAYAASVAVLGRSVVIVDDVVTTGATLREAARALRAAGAAEMAAACIAATTRRGAAQCRR